MVLYALHRLKYPLKIVFVTNIIYFYCRSAYFTDIFNLYLLTYPFGDKKMNILGQKRNAAFKDQNYCALNESYKISSAIIVSLLFLTYIIPNVSLSSVNPNQCIGYLFIFKFFTCIFIILRFTHVIITEIARLISI